MILRGIDFGHVFNASGARGFFGEKYPYWFHRLWRPFGLRYDGSTFVAKTTTLEPRIGNMALGGDGTVPWEWFPKCIVVKPWRGVVLNAVGLSGPGAASLLNRGFWQERTEPFVLSFMCVGQSRSERLREASWFAGLVAGHKSGFRAPFAIEANFSCPNVQHDQEEMVAEASDVLDIIGATGAPIIPKINVLLPISAAAKVAEHPSCDALCVSNTIPWGALPDRIDWHALFGIKRRHIAGLDWTALLSIEKTESPLWKLGGGGLSGKPLLPLVREWLYAATTPEAEDGPVAITKPIIACGGILSKADADTVIDAGASAIELGCVSILRPWRVAGIIRRVNARFGAKAKNALMPLAQFPSPGGSTLSGPHDIA